jgi:hypothetical protein
MHTRAGEALQVTPTESPGHCPYMAGLSRVNGEELQCVRIRGHPLGRVELLEGTGEVVWCGPFSLMKTSGDLVLEHRSAPAVMCIFRRVPVAQHLVSSDQAWATARMYSRFRREKPFIVGNSARRSAARGSSSFAPQTLLRLPVQDCAPDAPPQLQKLVVDLPLRLESRCAHVLLEVFERGGA